MQGLGGLVIGGRFLVAWRTAFGCWFVSDWSGGHFGAVREIGGFVGARGHWRGTIFFLLWSWWFWGVDCVARGIRCVVRNWFCRLTGARGEIVCFGCWLVREVLCGACFLGAWSRLIGVDYCAGLFSCDGGWLVMIGARFWRGAL